MFQFPGWVQLSGMCRERDKLPRKRRFHGLCSTRRGGKKQDLSKKILREEDKLPSRTSGSRPPESPIKPAITPPSKLVHPHFSVSMSWGGTNRLAMTWLSKNLATSPASNTSREELPTVHGSCSRDTIPSWSSFQAQRAGNGGKGRDPKQKMKPLLTSRRDPVIEISVAKARNVPVYLSFGCLIFRQALYYSKACNRHDYPQLNRQKHYLSPGQFVRRPSSHLDGEPQGYQDPLKNMVIDKSFSTHLDEVIQGPWGAAAQIHTVSSPRASPSASTTVAAPKYN
ncbi:hypothetical protein BDK51DRAFT_34489 [Blyttiomyces helicus]|uniref:Uncharacterized protein n=1 Tax=Blyttiomyces helicus TaxID=388810 RepID=A0A4P9WA26_9FUNG|nr:hypothetical protein BDK51DRAFT_34489 [Blyttiomyces helicus]|eukprot:RKO89274.1 hypothetical protein BDK51DRAFT_34489 [Blyttiomyces helicus]